MIEARYELIRMMPDAFPVFFAGRQPYPGQVSVMPEIVRGHNVLFASPTASGKTEAAVAPLYQRHISFKRKFLSTVYVAPTNALVNDLYERLLGYIGIRQSGALARYTGDRHELRTKSGVFCLLVTPEALDSLQLRRPDMLADVRPIVVDEIHLLHGQARGQQLRHVIDRIRKAVTPAASARDVFQVLGMTATLEDMTDVATLWLGNGAITHSHGAPRDIELQLLELGIHSASDLDRARALALSRWLHETGVEKILVFSNSRNGAHALSAHLHRELAGTKWPVHLHFGVLAAAERERVEEAMRTNRYGVCVATTTLEIGIDIGDVDAVVLSDVPRSVSGFLQRIGRGNRRTGTCVVAFRNSDDDERLVHALVDCGRRGDLDDVHEYNRPSVSFQQVLSLCWRATRQDRPLSIASLTSEAGSDTHIPVAHDMISTVCLTEVRGALVPCDRLMDEGDARRIHTVIASRSGNAVVDLRTGKTALRDADESSAGGAIFHTGSMRRLVAGSQGVYLADQAGRSLPLARIKGTGPARALSQSIVWGLARQNGFDPTRWRLEGDRLITWGGETMNVLLAGLLIRTVPGRRFMPSAESVSGPINMTDLSVSAIRDLARRTEKAGDLPLDVAAKFLSPSRFLGELSPTMLAQEKRNTIPWKLFYRWLDRVAGIDA